MDKNEILKVKKIRKILLLRINDELKDILKNKSNIKINSKTISEINQLYSLNEIQQIEKPVLYSHYVKTEETVVPKSKSQEKVNIRISKSVNKIKTRKQYKNKSNKSYKNAKQKTKEKATLDEESVSPLNSFFPKKVELGRKKINYNKSKNKGSIPNIPHKIIKLEEKETKHTVMSYSTRMNKYELNLNRLIGRITILKDNRINENIIKENIKKLRKYCYQLRKKKKKVKKVINYSTIGKDIDKNKKRNALKSGSSFKNINGLNRKESAINISKKTIDNIPIFNSSNKAKNILKLSKKSLSPMRPESKVKKALFSLVKKAKKKEKKANKNSLKTAVNITNITENEENEVPDIFQIHNKGLPFFHKTTVEVENKNSQDEEKEKGPKKKSLKKSAPKDILILRGKSKKIIEKEDKPLLQVSQIHKRESNNNQNRFLNLNYIYNRTNNKKKTKIEEENPINKKILKLDFKKADIADNSQTLIKLSKVNNGEIQKKIKKKPNKEKRIMRSSYASNQTDTLYFRSKENFLLQSATKKI